MRRLWLRSPRALFALLLGPMFVLCGCSGPISASPVQDLARVIPGPAAPLSIADGLKEAAFNLDAAVTVGALAKDDPAPRCIHGVMADLGLEGQAPAPSFTPKVSTVIGRGSVAYIRLRQAQQASGHGVTVPVDCKALVGQFVIDAARGGAKLLPGGGLLPSLR